MLSKDTEQLNCSETDQDENRAWKLRRNMDILETCRSRSGILGAIRNRSSACSWSRSDDAGKSRERSGADRTDGLSDHGGSGKRGSGGGTCPDWNASGGRRIGRDVGWVEIDEAVGSRRGVEGITVSGKEWCWVVSVETMRFTRLTKVLAYTRSVKSTGIHSWATDCSYDQVGASSVFQFLFWKNKNKNKTTKNGEVGCQLIGHMRVVVEFVRDHRKLTRRSILHLVRRREIETPRILSRKYLCLHRWWCWRGHRPWSAKKDNECSGASRFSQLLLEFNGPPRNYLRDYNNPGNPHRKYLFPKQTLRSSVLSK